MARHPGEWANAQPMGGAGATFLGVTVAFVLVLGVFGPAGASTPTTRRVSVNSSGAQVHRPNHLGSISADGGLVAWYCAALHGVAGGSMGVLDVFVPAGESGPTARRSSVNSGVAEVRGRSHFPSISADGRFVAFDSFASNLVSGDTNGFPD